MHESPRLAVLNTEMLKNTELEITIDGTVFEFEKEEVDD